MCDLIVKPHIYVGMCVMSMWIMCLYVNVSEYITYIHTHFTYAYEFVIISNPNPGLKLIVLSHSYKV